MGNFNPRNPSKYTGTNKNIVFFVTRGREPITSDFRQPETGSYYSIGTLWQVGRDPSTGSEGDLFILTKIAANLAYWAKFAPVDPSTGSVLSLSDTSDTKVLPDSDGNIKLEGGTGITITEDTINNKLTFEADGAEIAETITGDDSTALSPAAGNWNILGVGDTSTSGIGSTLSIKEAAASSFVVDPDSDYGTHTTIQAAITSASSGEVIIIRPGTYTEDLTLKAGVDLVSLGATYLNSGQVTIVGKCTLSSGHGVCSISNVIFQTNSDYNIVVSGSDDSYIKCYNCVFNIINNTAISYTNSSASSGILVDSCFGDISATGITFFECSGSGTFGNFGSIFLRNVNIRNSAESTTASNTSSSQVAIYNSRIHFALSTTSTGTYDIYNSTFSNQNQNTTCLVTAGTGTCSFKYSTLSSGSSSALSIGSGTIVNFSACTVSSSNTNAITGAGTIVYTPIHFLSSSSTVNTTTQSVRSFGPRIKLEGGAQIISGSGSPSAVITAPQGSLFLRIDGGGITSRAYINTNGSTAWTGIKTTA